MHVKILFSLFFLFSTSIVISQQNATTLIEKGDVLYAEKKIDQAIVYYTKAIHSSTRITDEVYIKRGNAYTELQDCEKANEDFSIAIERNPNNALAYNNRALCYLSLGDLDNALNDQKKVIELYQYDALAYNNLGLIYLKRKMFSEAIKAFSTALQYSANNHLFFYNRGNVYFQTQQYHKAIEDFKASSYSQPNFSDAYEYQGMAHIELKQWENAAISFSNAIRQKPTLTNYLNRAKCYEALKQYSEAAKDYAISIQMNPRNTTLYWSRGICLFESRDFENAMTDFSLLLKQNQDNQNALLYRGRSLIETKKFEAAKEDFKELIAKNPTFEIPYYEIARIHSLKKEYDLAMKFLSVSTLLNNTHSESYFLKAQLFLQQNDKASALKDIEHALQINPNDMRYRKLKADILK